MSNKPYLIFARHSNWDAWEIAAETDFPGEALLSADEQRAGFYQNPDAEILIVKVCNTQDLLTECESDAPTVEAE